MPINIGGDTSVKWSVDANNVREASSTLVSSDEGKTQEGAADRHR